ncbi:MAG: hypothetical protein M3083_10930 [Actinomycetota bacterium]|nr:hypothetical protein [Actinomycetota bacterium]
MASASIYVEPTEFSVTPDTMAVGQLRVRNEGSSAERFTLDVPGDAGSWVSVAPYALSVGPGEEGNARIFLRPPRSPSLRAGRHTVRIRVRPDHDRKQELAAIIEIQVAPFTAVSAALEPDGRASKGRASNLLTIDNRGNAPLRATVGAEPGGDVSVTVDPSSVEVEPGATVTVQVGARTRRRVLRSAQDHRFTVVVKPEGGEPVQVGGSMHQGPVVARPVLVALAALVAIALIGVVLRAVVFTAPHVGASRLAAPTPNCPAGGHLAHEANGQIRHDVVEPDNFSFLFLQPGGCLPVRWNPCAPIHYVVNGGDASPEQLADIRSAVAAVTQATGIDFVSDGTSSERPRGRRDYQPSLYGARWSPVLIEWIHLGGGNSLTEAAGGGIPMAVNGVDVSGVVLLNLDAHLAGNAPIPTGFGSGVTWGRILLHELGHVLGLGHVSGFEQIMHDPVTDQTSSTSAYGFGDLAGLRLVGKSAGCLTTPPIPGAPA